MDVVMKKKEALLTRALSLLVEKETMETVDLFQHSPIRMEDRSTAHRVIGEAKTYIRQLEIKTEKLELAQEMLVEHKEATNTQ